MSVETVAGLLRGRADDDHPALLFEDERYSWAEFVDAAGIRAGLALSRRREGPFHIGILLDNVPEFLFWIAGSALVGASAVGINPTRHGEELAHDIRHTDCQLIVTDRAHLPLLEGVDTGVEPGRIILIDTPDYAASLAALAGVGLPVAEVSGSDRLLLLFTSGSTGAPKAVICSQRRLATIAAMTPEKFGISRDTVTYQSMPLFHGNALMANWAPVLGTGATMAMARRFSATGFLPDVRRFGASFFNYVGRSLAYVLATPEAADDADNPLRLGFGTEASARDMETFTRRFGCDLLENYGSSEGAINTEKPAGAPANSIGRPRPGSDVAIVDPATRRECPRPASTPRADWSTATRPSGRSWVGTSSGRSRATTTTPRPKPSGSGTAGTGAATSATATETDGSTSPVGAGTGSGSTARTSPPRPSSGSSPVIRPR